MKSIESVPAAQGKVPLDKMQALQTAMNSLESSLLKLDPEMKRHLQESHRLLITYPESTHLLEDSEIALLLQAAQKQMQVQIVSDIAKKSPGRKPKTAPSVEDL